jgi:hypothetical protein
MLTAMDEEVTEQDDISPRAAQTLFPDLKSAKIRQMRVGRVRSMDKQCLAR